MSTGEKEGRCELYLGCTEYADISVDGGLQKISQDLMVDNESFHG